MRGRNRRRVTDLRGTVRNREVVEGVCCRTLNLVTSAYHLVTLSLGSGIEKEKLFQIQSLKRIYLGYLKKRREKKESCGVTSAGITYALTPSGYSQGLSPFKEESLSRFGCIPRKCGVCKAGV